MNTSGESTESEGQLPTSNDPVVQRSAKNLKCVFIQGKNKMFLVVRSHILSLKGPAKTGGFRPERAQSYSVVGTEEH